jgi:DNA-binding SARP family transcriptional activator
MGAGGRGSTDGPAGGHAGRTVARGPRRYYPRSVDEVTLRLAGTFAVSGNGGLAPPIGGGKARRLLILLAVERHRTVPIDRIVEVLWGEHPPARPVQDVATLVSRLRAALGPGVITGGREGYALGRPPAVAVDVEEAARLVAEARRLLAAAAPRAVDVLATGGLLDGEPDADWVRDARADAGRLLRDARHALGTAALGTGEPAVARAAAEAAVAADPLDEEAYRLLMAAHQLGGEPARALVAYERLRTDLAGELGTDPDPRTRALHAAILREQEPAVVARPRSPGCFPSWNRPWGGRSRSGAAPRWSCGRPTR